MFLLVACTAARGGDTPLGNAFTYQGRLTQSGAPINGLVDLEFRLFDGSGGGALQVGVPAVQNSVSVVEGVFTVDLDFGPDLFEGSERWLEIAVRSPAGGGGGFTTLAPRQSMRGTPYALYALNAGALEIANFPTGGNWALASGLNVDSETFHIDPVSNRVGVGTRTPAHALQVIGRIDATSVSFAGGSILDADQGGNIELGPPDSAGGQQPYLDFHFGGGAPQDYSARIQSRAGDQLNFDTSTGGNVMSLIGGKVGVGTESPLAKLHVVNALDGNYAGIVRREESGTDQSLNVLSVQAGSTGVTAPGFGAALNFSLQADNGGTAAAADIKTVWTDATVPTLSADMVFAARNGAPALVEHMRITSAGNVGIGTSAPDHTFQIVKANDPLTGPVMRLAGVVLNQPESGRVRFTEVSGDYRGGYMRYDGFSNSLHIGVHAAISSSTADDVDAISINRDSGLVTISGELTVPTLPATTRYFAIAPGAFTPWTDTDEYVALYYLEATNSAQAVNFNAPVYLPHGATVTALEARVLDNAAENMTVALNRVSDSGVETLMASDVSAGASASVQSLSDNTIVGDLVDNTTYSYQVRASWPVPAVTASIRLYRVQITYTVTSPLP